MIPLSVLDLAPIPEGSNAAEALRRSPWPLSFPAASTSVWGEHPARIR
jgi:hypothetical protein